jgi:hypothetical protein
MTMEIETFVGLWAVEHKGSCTSFPALAIKLPIRSWGGWFARTPASGGERLLTRRDETLRFSCRSQVLLTRSLNINRGNKLPIRLTDATPSATIRPMKIPGGGLSGKPHR